MIQIGTFSSRCPIGIDCLSNLRVGTAFIHLKCLYLLLVEINFLHDDRFVMLSLLTFLVLELLNRHRDFFELSCVVGCLHRRQKFLLLALQGQLRSTAHSLREIYFDRLIGLRRIDGHLSVFDFLHLAAVPSTVLSNCVAFFDLFRT